MKSLSIPVFLAAAFAATPGLSQTAAGKSAVTGATTASPQKAKPQTGVSGNGQAIIEAARSGDENVMRRLTGAPVTLEGRMSRRLRESPEYLEIAVLTGPDFKLAGTRSGIEVVLRIPRSLAPDPLPDAITSSGTLTGFEPTTAPGERQRIAFTPIVTVDFLR